MDKDEKLNKDIINRLKRIEGQVKGIQGMVDKNVFCDDILIQVLAVRSAINKVGGMIIESYANNCLQLDENSKEYENVKKLIKNINTFIK